MLIAGIGISDTVYPTAKDEGENPDSKANAMPDLRKKSLVLR
jgi:hypothetical protein